ncbi:hypothetical protein U1Q18_007375, partial [Sarracenia purpurea var. burkii]
MIQPDHSFSWRWDPTCIAVSIPEPTKGDGRTQRATWIQLLTVAHGSGRVCSCWGALSYVRDCSRTDRQQSSE